MKKFTADDAGKKRIQRDELLVQQVMEAVKLRINPFETSGQLLHLLSGKHATTEVADSLLSAHELGQQALTTFVQASLELPQEHVDVEPVSYYHTIPQVKVKTFDSMKVAKKRSVKGQTILLKMSRDLFHKLTVMSTTRNIDIEKVL